METSIERFVEVGDCLRLDPLRGIHNEDGTFTRSYTSTYLVAEVNVAWSINEIEEVVFAIFRVPVHHGGCLCQHRDSSISFDL